MDVRSLVIRLGFGLDSRGADQADKRVANLSKNADGLAKKMALAGAALAGVGAYKIANELRESVDASISFGREMGNISSLIGGNQARTQELATASQQMALKFGRSSKDITGGLYEVISTFGDTKDAIEQTQIAIKIGAAGAGTTADGISLLGAVTKAYGDTSAATMRKVSDLGFQTINLGKVTLPELAGSIQQATPLAAALGVKLEELFAIQATASGVTGSGSEVFTQMNSAMKALMERTPEMAKAFRKAFANTGVKTAKDAVGKFGLVGALQKVIATTDGSQEQIGKLFGRIEGLKLGLALTGNQAGDFTEKMKAMQNVSGATDTAFKAQTTGLANNAFEMDKLNTRAEVLQQQVGDRMAGTFIAAKAGWIEFAEVALGGLATGFDNAAAASDRLNSSAGKGPKTPDSALGRATNWLGNAVAWSAEGVAGGADFIGFGLALPFRDDAERAEAAKGLKERHAASKARRREFALAASDPEAAANEADLRRVNLQQQAETAAARADYRARHLGHGGSLDDLAREARARNSADKTAALTPSQIEAARVGARKSLGLKSQSTHHNTMKVDIHLNGNNEVAGVTKAIADGWRAFTDGQHDQAARASGGQP